VFGIAAKMGQRNAQPVTKDEPYNFRFDASYGFNMAMNRGKTEFRVKKSGLYVVAYYIAAKPPNDTDTAKNLTANLNIQRCGDPGTEPESTKYNDWTNDNNKVVIWAAYIKFLNKGDKIDLSIITKQESPSIDLKVSLAALAAVRLMPCNCIPPGGLPAIDFRSPLLPSGYGSGGIISAVKTIATSLLSGPLSEIASAVLPALLKDSLPDILQNYLSQNAPEADPNDYQYE
jgi:hypothetical protein